MLCIMTPFDGKAATVGNGTMTAIGVSSRDEVERIHAKALELGGQDEGAPGLRAEGGPGAGRRPEHRRRVQAGLLTGRVQGPGIPLVPAARRVRLSVMKSVAVAGDP
jgi:hypothetical protein